MGRVLFGIVAPILVLFIVWVFGNPPATSMFWQTETGVVSGHQTRLVTTGYGDVSKTVPQLSIPGRDALLDLNLNNFDGAEAVIAEWPIGRSVAVKLSPSGYTAYPTDDPRRGYVVHLAVMVLGLTIIVLTIRSYFVAVDVGTYLMAGIGAVFVVLPIGLCYGIWTSGDPPATAIFWPSQKAEVQSSTVKTFPVGNGTNVDRAIVFVRPEGGHEDRQVLALRPALFEARSADEIAAEFPVGETVRLKRSPSGGLYEPRWRFNNWLSLFISILAPFMVAVGGLLVFAALGGRNGARS